MGQGTIEYYRYKISRGMEISAERLPRRDLPPKRYYEPLKDSEDAAVCLNCDRKKCAGTQKCFDRQRDKCLAQRAAKKKGG